MALGETAPAPPAAALSGAAFEAVFPFHVVVGTDMRILQVGKSLHRIAADAVLGSAFDVVFAVDGADRAISLATIVRDAEQVVLLRHRTSGIRLRGQFVAAADARCWMFLGSPWFDSAAELDAAGLTLGDFAPYDPISDVLMLLESKQLAMRDLRDLAARIDAQRRELQETEALYRTAIVALDAVPYRRDLVESRYTYLGDRIRELTGYAPSALTPAILRGLIVDAPGASPFDDLYARSLGLHGKHRAEYLILPRNGDARWLSDSSVPVRDGDGRVVGAVGILTDVTQRKLSEQRLNRLGAELNTILALIPGGVIAFNARGRIIYVNDGFTAMTGLRPDELYGRSAEQFDADFARLCSADVTAPSSSFLADYRTDNVRLERPKKMVLARSAAAIRDNDGQPLWRVIYFRDVTREAEVDRAKSEFLSTAAHELRTPMASVHGFAELLMARSYDEATVRRIAGTIHQQSSVLVHMVSELLDLARIEAGRAREFDLQPAPLAALVRETLAALLVPGDGRQIDVGAESEADGAIVIVDRQKFQLALTNVLANAYKYSSGRGAIALSYCGFRGGDGDCYIGVRIVDHGIGMAPDQLARVFERFYRADPAGAIPGTGLGMSLVREIIELMNGYVEISSRLGEGTEVTLWLPVAAAPARLTAQRSRRFSGRRTRAASGR